MWVPGVGASRAHGVCSGWGGCPFVIICGRTYGRIVLASPNQINARAPGTESNRRTALPPKRTHGRQSSDALFASFTANWVCLCHPRGRGVPCVCAGLYLSLSFFPRQWSTPIAVPPVFVLDVQLHLRFFALRSCAPQQRYARIAVAATVRSWSAIAFALVRIVQLRTPAAVRPYRCGRLSSFQVCSCLCHRWHSTVAPPCAHSHLL